MQTFDQSASFYDAVYAARGKNYEIESEILWSHIMAQWSAEGPPRALLDVACGTGEHLKWLQDQVPTLLGTDASAAMLDVARTKLPHVTFLKQAMNNLHVEQSFDVVTCLFAAIGYVQDESTMRAAIGRMADHLSSFGVLAIEPAVRPETVQPPTTSTMTVQLGASTIQRVTSGTLDRERNVLHVHFHYTITPGDGSPSRTFQEEHPIQLFSDDCYRSALADAGLTNIAFDERGISGTGLYTARRAR